MNILGWLITITLATSSAVVFLTRDRKCPCDLRWRSSYDKDQLVCRNHQLFEVSDVMSQTSKGSCTATMPEYIDRLFKCVVNKRCVDYLTEVLKVVLILALPLLLSHE
jgi:hypothetical protein